MFRVAGKPAKAVDKEGEKRKARRQVYRAVITFGAIIAALRLGEEWRKYALSYSF